MLLYDFIYSLYNNCIILSSKFLFTTTQESAFRRIINFLNNINFHQFDKYFHETYCITVKKGV
jgi:hypothetical protein